MSREATLPEAELLESPADLLQAPDAPTDALDMESTKQPRRVKVYEMKGEAWCDRGTGFCQGLIKDREAVFFVNSEDSKDNVLLESKIIKDDLYQIQQNTLIVWQELNGLDVALSFQEEEGCLEIWNFLRHVQKLLNGQDWDGPEDARPVPNMRVEDDVSDDDAEPGIHEPVYLPEPTLAKLQEVEEMVHLAMTSVGRRESLAKFVLNENYVPKLIAALEMAEDMESIVDLHRLCNIVKALILLNDAAIFESILQDDTFLGVAGILEYDPDFPNHKAEHRKYLGDGSKFKEVVEVKDPEIKRKIHQTFRLQYLKDVVLARILDDPTFSILNTLIFFNQVDIIQHFQHNEEFLLALFGLFDPAAKEPATLERKSDAILFIQQSTGIAKTLQIPARAALYQTFVDHGLFRVLVFSLGSEVASNVRLAGADIVMAVIDHDPKLIRSFIIEQNSTGQTTLCDTLVNLLISEKDLGIKAQMAEAMRLLVDPAAGPPIEGGPQKANDPLARQRKEDPEAEKFLELFYLKNVLPLMSPLLEADFKRGMVPSVERTALYTHLCDLLCFFIRAHTFRSKFFILSQNISVAISHMFLTSERHLHLAALRFFRVCIGINDEFYNRHLIKNNLFEPIVDMFVQSAHRNNLLNSATLEFFETIRRESMKGIIYNLVETCRPKLESIKLETARSLIYRYEQYQAPPPPPPPPAAKEEHPTTEEPETTMPRSGRWQDRASMDQKEQEYFEQDENAPPRGTPLTPSKRPLIDSEYDREDIDPKTPPNQISNPIAGSTDVDLPDHPITPHKPIDSEPDPPAPDEAELAHLAASVDDKIGEKRRRSEDDEDATDLIRSRKASATESTRSGTSPGGIASAVKRKMMFSFGKKERKEDRTRDGWGGDKEKEKSNGK